ncbi:hypothetical protein C8R46DRAFT_1223358 [Mycena filopes]|nr:hypothetical protein C8R46DRAFT_1223358 [Mycena filopes]
MKFSNAFLALVPLVVALPNSVVRTTDDEVAACATCYSDLETRSTNILGNVYVCSEAGFVNTPPAICKLLHSGNGECVNLPPGLDNAGSSIGPDPGQNCEFYTESDCGTQPGAQLIGITYPGHTNLQTVGLNDVLSSFKCEW